MGVTNEAMGYKGVKGQIYTTTSYDGLGSLAIWNVMKSCDNGCAGKRLVELAIWGRGGGLLRYQDVGLPASPTKKAPINKAHKESAIQINQGSLPR